MTNQCPDWWTAVQSFLVPGLVVSLIFLAMGQQLIGSILIALNVAFLSWVLFHRFGLLSRLTIKKGVSFNLRHMDENLHSRLYQVKCLKNIIALIDHHKKGPRIVEKHGIRIILRAFILYSDNEKDSEGETGGDVEITELALQALFGLLRTSPKDSTEHILKKWTVHYIAGYVDEITANLDLAEETRNTLLVWVLKIVSQLSEHTAHQVRATGVGWSSVLMQSILNCMKQRLRDQLKSGEHIQQWGICSLFNLQHNTDPAKDSFSKHGGFTVVLDAVRRYRQSLKINQLAAVLMAECVFESVVKNTTELKFLPEVFAEALSSGVMSALQDMQKEYPNNSDIYNCNRLLKSEYGKPRKVDVDVECNHVEFIELN